MKTALAIGVCLLVALPARAQYPTVGSQLNPAAFGRSPAATPGPSGHGSPPGPSAPPLPFATSPSIAPPASSLTPGASGSAAVAAGSGQVHPAVARIVAPGQGSVSYGSGTLVHVGADYGLVITNWHVVNEATAPISVHFPDGFYSLGTVRNVDRDWDLAAIAIRRPSIQPVPMASQPPRPGEVLTIAGYGSGTYRSASGPCTQYVAPGLEFPYEMVEVAVSARQGDSGGPIFNSRGELAGVLFGEGHGRTSGSYCGRVRWFLTSVVPPEPAASSIAEMRPLAPVPQRPPSLTASLHDSRPLAAVESGPMGSGVSTSGAPTPPAGVAVQPASIPQPASSATAAIAAPSLPDAPLAAVSPGVEITATEALQIGWQDIAGDTWGQQFKTVLAGIGALALLLQALKWLGRQEAAT